MKKINQLLVSMVIISLVLPAFAASASHIAGTTIGRYLSIQNKPKPDQLDLLAQTIQVHFPPTVQTVGDAMAYLLRFSGYSLLPETDQNAALKTTLTKPLPIVDRNFGPMALKDGLTTLAGPAFTLVQDPLNRQVDFHLKPPYSHLHYANSHSSAKSKRG